MPWKWLESLAIQWSGHVTRRDWERKEVVLRDMSLMMLFHCWLSERGFLSAQQLSQGDKSTKTLLVRCVCLCWISHRINKNEQARCRVTRMAAKATQHRNTTGVIDWNCLKRGHVVVQKQSFCISESMSTQLHTFVVIANFCDSVPVLFKQADLYMYDKTLKCPDEHYYMT